MIVKAQSQKVNKSMAGDVTDAKIGPYSCNFQFMFNVPTRLNGRNMKLANKNADFC